MDAPERIVRIKADDLLDEERLSATRQYILHGKPEHISFKLHCFRHHLHDLLANEICRQEQFTHCNDIDSAVITGLDLDLTPDLYNSEHKIWADVTISANEESAVASKRNKYSVLLLDESYTLVIYVYETQQCKLWAHPSTKSKVLEKQEIFLSDAFTQAILNGLNFYDSSNQFFLSTEKPKTIQIATDFILCSEARLLADSDNGVLNDLLERNSYDSDDLLKQQFAFEREQKLNEIAKQISEDAKRRSTNFKFASTDSLIEAYNLCEQSVEQNYEVLVIAKPSCHGISAEIAKYSTTDEDTRHLSISSMREKLEGTKCPIFMELLFLINFHEQKTFPGRSEKIKELEEIVNTMNYSSYSQIEPYIKRLATLRSMHKWDRSCLRTRKSSLIEAAMRIGSRKHYSVKRVNTVPFWLPGYSDDLELYLKEKSNKLCSPEHCWTPHKEYKPKLREAGDRYNQFIVSELYQEIAFMGQLAGNILRLATKPRKFSSLTTCGNPNLLAIVGSGDGCMNEASTVPILWIGLNSKENPLWSTIRYQSGPVCMTDGDRLTKARLEQMVDAPRIASIAASICCTEMEGQDCDINYLCGILSCVAMSINIRDSELIDHIRYLVPNIFSDRSCAPEYVREKYSTALKTKLQALIYKETKKTILKSSELVRIQHEVEMENEEVVSGGSTIKIPFFDCFAQNVYKLNGIVYTAFFSCKKGLHSPRIENKKMFDKICEYEYPNYLSDIVKSSFDKDSPHYFDPVYVSYTMSSMVDAYSTEKGWRSEMHKMESLKKPYEIATFSSLRSSLKMVNLIPEIRSLTAKNKVNSSRHKDRMADITESWDEIWSDSRTRVVDHFFDVENTILEEGQRLLKEKVEPGFYCTWDQKRQRTGRDREVFILDPEGKVFMHNVESLFRVVCDGLPHEQITLPGNKKILAMSMKGAQYFKNLRKELNVSARGKELQHTRVTMDMTKWAPADNVCKFIYAIAGLNFLKRCEKICYINFLCTSLRKQVVLNSTATEAIGAIIADQHLSEKSMWAQMLGVKDKTEGICTRVKRNVVPVKYNWLMGVLNSTSSAVHAASASMLKRVLKQDYNVIHYEPDVHSDDAALDFIGYAKQSDLDILDFMPKVIQENLSYACIRLSEKKSYLDKYRKEFVSEVDDNGLIKSYWQKQAIAAISGVSYVDFFRDICEGSAKVANVISLGGPPSVYEVVLSNVIDLSRDTYSMQPGMWNDTDKFLPVEKDNLPLELGGSFTMNPILLPITGIKYQTFSNMMDQVLRVTNRSAISEITESEADDLRRYQGNLFCKAWAYTAEVAAKEDLILNKLDTGLIRFKQFSSYDKVKSLRVMKELSDVSKEDIDKKLDEDPTFAFRSACDIAEHKFKLAMMIKNPKWYAAATLQSQGALKLDRMFNVRSPCCMPVTQPGEVMEVGMKTIREALSDALKTLEGKDVNLHHIYCLLKSMPLMCYVYDLEKQAEFQPGGSRTLFPVVKENFLKGTVVNSSVVGLLQKYYTGETNYSIDYVNLPKELKLVEQYVNSLSLLEKHMQAATIYKILQQTGGFSSVYYVPSPRLRNHMTILGVMSLQFSDKTNWFPVQRYEPPVNEIYKSLRIQRELNIGQKCSELAGFLMRICSSERHARHIFTRCNIEGTSVLNILDSDNHNFRDVAYANALLGIFPSIQLVRPKELVWLVPQKRGYPHWTGDFFCYLNYGTKDNPRGMFLKGAETILDEIIFLGTKDDYPDLKDVLIFFSNKMRWFGSLTKHLREVQYDAGVTTVKLHTYGSNFQVRYSDGGLGLKIRELEPRLHQPIMKFNELTRYGVKFSIDYGPLSGSVQGFNQRVTQHFAASSEEKVGPFSFNKLWESIWNSISVGTKVCLDYHMVKSDSSLVYLPRRTVENLNTMGHNLSSALEQQLTADRIVLARYDPSNAIETSIFCIATPWAQDEFNFYFSYALHMDSSIKLWISLRGYLQDLHRNYKYIGYDRMFREFGKNKSKFSMNTNVNINRIYENRKIEAEVDADDFTKSDFEVEHGVQAIEEYPNISARQFTRNQQWGDFSDMDDY